MAGERSDPRFRRVRERLVSTVMELASTRPPESISVSELTAAAGVSRAVFYAHATSPAALLADALIAEIRPDLEATLAQLCRPNADYVGLWRRLYLDFLEHGRRRRAVFRVITEHESSVYSMLIAYLEAAAEPCIRAIFTHLDGPAPTELWTRIAVSQQAHNMMSVLRAWLLTDVADPPDTVVDTYLTLAPPWQLGRADEHGHISLRRTRVLHHLTHPDDDADGTWLGTAHAPDPVER